MQKDKTNVLKFSGGQKINPKEGGDASQDQEKSIQQQLQELATDEDQQIVHQETGLKVGDVLDALLKSEIGMARLFCVMFRNKLCFNTSLGSWYVYKNCCWCSDKLSEHIDSCRTLYEFVSYVKANFMTGLKKNTEQYIIRQISSISHITNMNSILKQAAAGVDGLGAASEDFDKDLIRIGAPNGIVDLETGVLLPDDPSLLITKQVGTPYDPEAPEPERFMSFLREIFKYPVEREKVEMEDEEYEVFCKEQCESLIRYVQTLCGYALLGTCKEHVFIVFFGPGRNGKGVLFRSIHKALGDYAAEVQPSLLLSKKISSPDSPNPAVADLKGMRIAMASETNQGEFFDTSSIKRLTGGDTLVARKPYAKDFISFKPTHTLILQTNFRPNAPAEDQGFWDRVKLIPFLRRFVNEPDPNTIYEAPIDRDLEEKLSEELPGILKWIVDGAIKYKEDGLNPPDCIKDAVNAYRLSRDFLADFIDECCEVGPGLRVRTPKFTDAFNEWRRTQGFRSSLNYQVLRERLEYKGFERGKSSNKVFKGLNLNMIGEEYLKPVNDRRIIYDENPFMGPAEMEDESMSFGSSPDFVVD